MPTPQPIQIQPKNIVISKHADINVKFPKMGIWVLSTIGDIDVVSIGATEITSILEGNGKSYPILSVKEKWDYNFNPPYVFTGPFGTTDSAIAFAKSAPNQAIVEKSKTVAATKKYSAGGGSGSGPVPPQPAKNYSETPNDLKQKMAKMLKEKLPKIQEEQKRVLNRFDSLISSQKKNPAKAAAFSLLKESFINSVNAMNQNIWALTNAIDAYATIQPNKPIDDVINGKTLPQIIEQCAECNAGALEALAKIVEKG